MGGGAQPDDSFAATVRRHDADRYIATLYAPQMQRPALWAVYAFAAELALVPGQVTQSALGEIRLQWWRQTVDDICADNTGEQVGGHPLTGALAPVVKAQPIIAGWLRAMIDGRSADLYADPMDDLPALEAYFGAKLSLPIRMAIALLTPGADERGAADAAGHGGVALGLVRLGGHFADVINRRPELLPRKLLVQHGLEIEDLRSEIGGEAARLILSDLQSMASKHLDQAVSAARSLPAGALPALLPLAPLKGDMALIAKRGAGPGGSTRRGALYRQWCMWRAAKRGSIY